MEEGRYKAPRDVATHAILKEVAAGRGSPSGGAYQPYPGQSGAGPGGRRLSPLAWLIPLVVLILAGAGLGAYFGLRGDDGKTVVSTNGGSSSPCF